MTSKIYQLKDGNVLAFPKTVGKAVKNAAGETLENVEAGAQVNVIELIKVNGTALTPSSKAVNIEIADAAEYEIKECATAQTGYLKSYQLEKDGVKVGDYINIPKDFLVKSASCKTCEQKDTPVEGYEVGDKYLDFVINVKSGTATDEHLYVNVKDLVDTYTAGNGLNLDDGEFSVDTSVVATQSDLTTGLGTKENTLTGDKLAAVNSGINSTKVGNYDTHLANSDIHVTSSQKTEWSGKQDAITSSSKLSADLISVGTTNAVITNTEKSAYDEYATEIASKADATQTAAAIAAKQDEITSTNKLSADLISVGTTNAVITKTEKAAYDGYASTIAAKANSSDVYTKTESDSKYLTFEVVETYEA